MLSQELIYQNLHAKNYSAVITLLYENGNQLNTDPNVDYAINMFMNEFFNQIKIVDPEIQKELNHDLDILFISHTEGKYKLSKEQAIQLIHLLHPRVSKADLYNGAKDYPEDSICKEIIDWRDQRAKEALEKSKMPINVPILNQSSTFSLRGQKFETTIGNKDTRSWIKVFLRSNELLDIVAAHIRKLSSVGLVNITEKDNGHNDLTIYPRRPFVVEEVHDEVKLTLENYFSRSPADPIFKEDVISGISDVAYFQILDYMLTLGYGLEGFRQLSVKMDEERYRDYFVAYLDSLSKNHTATGETFHGNGKSDILFRNHDKEVLLVAECKLWTGKEALSKALDQLFGRYVNWRDGKAALLIFNTKNKDFTKIIEVAVETLKLHHLFLSFEGKRQETSFSFFYRNVNDSKKLIKLELILFNFV